MEEKKIHTRTRRKIKRLKSPRLSRGLDGSDENPTKTPKLGGHKHNDPPNSPGEATRPRGREKQQIKPGRSGRSSRDRSLNLRPRGVYPIKASSTKRGTARPCVFVVLVRNNAPPPVGYERLSPPRLPLELLQSAGSGWSADASPEKGQL